MSMRDKMRLTWFDRGSAMFDGILDDPDGFPPLNDRESQRAWLAGFGGAWAELPEDPERADDPRNTPLLDVLSHRLADRPELLAQLLAIGRTATVEFVA